MAVGLRFAGPTLQEVTASLGRESDPDQPSGSVHLRSASFRRLSDAGWQGAIVKTGCCMIDLHLTIIDTTRTEDKVLQRCNLSVLRAAIPNRRQTSTAGSFIVSTIQPSDLAPCDKPSWHDARTSLTGCHTLLHADPNASSFHLPLNQHRVNHCFEVDHDDTDR
jgi:hypothetical protein